MMGSLDDQDLATMTDTSVGSDALTTPSLMEHLHRSLARVPDFVPPAATNEIMCPLPAVCSQEQLNEFRSAGVFLKSLSEEVQAWRQQLPAEFRPAVIAVLHGGIQIHVHSLAQVSFDGIRIEGSLEGAPCSLLAHQSTVQMLCYAEPVPEEPAEAHRGIGFIWADGNIKID
jgi:hypothetical protein